MIFIFELVIYGQDSLSQTSHESDELELRKETLQICHGLTPCLKFLTQGLLMETALFAIAIN